jgi:hypothetical protein
MWSYDTALATQKDQVRLRIGDTDPIDEQLQDEEINYLISIAGASVDAVALLACDVLIAKYSRYVDESMDGTSLSHSQRLKAYQMLRSQIEEGLTSSIPVPVFGSSVGADGQTVEPFFTRETPESVWPR